MGAGPTYDRWSTAGDDAVSRLGGTAHLEATLPLRASLAVVTRGSLGVSGSPFLAADLEDTDAEPATAWRALLSVGVRLGL